MTRVPSLAEVLMKPLVVRFESFAIFCVVLTVTVLVERVSPVLNVKGTSYAEEAVYAAVPSVPPVPILSVLLSVPESVKVFAEFNVLPLAIVRVPVDDVNVRPLILVDVAAPSVGVTRVGEVAKTSDPVPVSFVNAVMRLADVGVVKNVPTFVPSVIYAPVPRVPPVPIFSVDPSVPEKVSVLEAVSVFVSAIVSVDPVEGVVILSLLILVAVADPRTGVMSVGELMVGVSENTTTHHVDPVSSERTDASCAEVVDESALRLLEESMSVPVVSGSV